MKYIGIDPGNTQTAISIIDEEGYHQESHIMSNRDLIDYLDSLTPTTNNENENG